MGSLYNITGRFIELAEKEDLSEEEKNEMSQNLCTEFQTKSLNIVGYVKNVDSEVVAIDAEIEKLTKRKEYKQKKLQRFLEYVKTNMDTLGIESIETPIGTLKIKKNPPSIEIMNKDLIPSEYIKTKIIEEPDKNAIKKAFLEDGEIVAGTRVITGKTRLSID